jgi:hypothetical protein
MTGLGRLSPAQPDVVKGGPSSFAVEGWII